MSDFPNFKFTALPLALAVELEYRNLSLFKLDFELELGHHASDLSRFCAVARSETVELGLDSTLGSRYSESRTYRVAIH